jgi:hypothetical protein
MVFHVVGFSCFSLKIGEMEIFHKTHNRVIWGGKHEEKGEWEGKNSPLNFPHACSS